MLDKAKLIEMAKVRGLVLAEEALEQGAKGIAHLAIDIIEELVKGTDTPIDDVAFAAVSGVARDMADKIEVNL